MDVKIIKSKAKVITKVNGYMPSGFSMCTISSFRSIENKQNVYRYKDCIKQICEF